MPYEVYEDRNKPKRSVWRAMASGARNTCPECGAKPMFRQFLKPHDNCPSCGLDFSGHRADDLPPYITIMIAGHIIVWGILVVERLWAPAVWLQLSIWLPVTLLLCLWLMQPVKGAVIGLQWALRMHGFDDEATKESDERGKAA